MSLFSTIFVVGLSFAFLYVFPSFSINGVNSTNNVSALTYSSNTDVSFTFNPTLSISLSKANINIDNLLPGLSSESSPITVHVNSNTPYGYSLFASVGNSTEYNTTSLTHEDSSTGNNAVFTSIDTNASLPQLTTDNTWGYTYRTHNTNNTDNEGWSNYNGLPLYSTVDNNTSTNNPALLIDTKNPADSTESIDFKIAAKASSTQASGTYNNVINFYAVGKPEPRYLYDEVAKMSKGTQTLADLQIAITAPNTADYREDTSNSGVYEYNSAVFGESSDASNANKIYYYRGILEPEADQGSFGSDGGATTYPNYVKLSNDTCWRIVRTTGSGGVKMIYNGIWSEQIDFGTCANRGRNARTGDSYFNGYALEGEQTVRVGYTYDAIYANNSKTYEALATIFGTNASDNNTADSTLKKNVDNWYREKLISYTDILEPSAGYCGDRTTYNSSNVLQPESNMIIQFGTNSTRYNFGAYVKNQTENQSPSFACAKHSDGVNTVDRSKVDLYSLVGTSTGNGRLTYPIALLTADEITLAGSGSGRWPWSYKTYLSSGASFWLISPYYRDTDAYLRESALFGNDYDSSGFLTSYPITQKHDVRPVISLNAGITIDSGSGTSTDPWLINE